MTTGSSENAAAIGPAKTPNDHRDKKRPDEIKTDGGADGFVHAAVNPCAPVLADDRRHAERECDDDQHGQRLDTRRDAVGGDGFVTLHGEECGDDGAG
jgi:hypothetical protein